MYNSQITSERIKQLAKDKNISLLLLSEQCGLSKDTIKTAGKSENGMKAKNLCMIADYLDVSVDYLLGRTNDPNLKNSNNININGNNSKVISNISNVSINSKASSEEIAEMAEMMKSLSLVERSKVVLFIDEMKRQAK
ncbi:MAG: helix-turn-helix domain-containing protein [Ruminococcus sp.]|nr:helix-turn-helix domain-containing protein [Ruminococcus sp.]